MYIFTPLPIYVLPTSIYLPGTRNLTTSYRLAYAIFGKKEKKNQHNNLHVPGIYKQGVITKQVTDWSLIFHILSEDSEISRDSYDSSSKVQQSANNRNVRITRRSHRCTKIRQPRCYDTSFIKKYLQDDVADEFNMIGLKSRRTRDMSTPHIECTPLLVLNARRTVLNEHSNPQPDGSTAVRLSLTLDLTQFF